LTFVVVDAHSDHLSSGRVDPVGRSGQPHELATTIWSPIAAIGEQDDRLPASSKLEQLVMRFGHRLTLVARPSRQEIAGDQHLLLRFGQRRRPPHPLKAGAARFYCRVVALTSPLSTERPLVRIASTNGRVEVVAEERDDVDVRGDADVIRAGRQTAISSENARLKVRVPVGVDIIIGTTSGRVSVSGDVGVLSVITESGTVTVERVRSADVRSDSGRIEIGQSDEDCRIRSESGSVSVTSCRRATVATRSGRIDLKGVRGAVQAHCTSGRITITMTTANDVEAETVTGRIAVSLPQGVRAFRTEVTAGQATPNDADCTVSARSVTGRVDVANR